MTSISAIGTYLPRLRLSRAAIAAALQWLTPSAGAGKGSRTLAFWDEDSITMGVEAGRACLAVAEESLGGVATLHFATTTPVFAELQNASLIHAALRLPRKTATQDTGGTRRAGLIALKQALESETTSLVVASDLQQNPAGSLGESRSGDGAAAVLVTTAPGLLTYLGGGTATSSFADRYRVSGEDFAQDWEERWVREEGFLQLVPEAISEAMTSAGVTSDQIDHFVMPATISGLDKAVAAAAGLKGARLAATLYDHCGDIGSGHAILMLAKAMESMKPGERVLVAQFGQGATALVFEATDIITSHRPLVSQSVAAGIAEEAYLKLPIFRGLLAWDKGLRGRVNVNEALSTAYRRSSDLLGFVGGRCRETGIVQFPASRIPVADEAHQGFRLDTLDPWPLADRGGRIATSTADLLAFSRNPPNCYGLVDFNGGGRLMMDFTDPDADQLKPGDAVRFVFRVKDIDERTGYRRYFWKAVSTPSAAQ